MRPPIVSQSLKRFAAERVLCCMQHNAAEVFWEAKQLLLFVKKNITCET